MGTVPSPFDCSLAQCGAKTLALRKKTHGLNALGVARTLQTLTGKGKTVDEMAYPDLPGRTEANRMKNSLAWRIPDPHGSASRTLSTLGATCNLRRAALPFSDMISLRLTIPTSPASNHLGTASFQTANTFLTFIRLFTLVESLGGVEILAEHPAETDLSRRRARAAGRRRESGQTECGRGGGEFAGGCEGRGARW